MSLPTFTCPKCGAVADLEFRAGATQEDVDAAHARMKSSGSFEGTLRWRWRMEQAKQDVERGERLEASCPRCKHTWQEKPLDADPSGPTPIYDALSEASA